MRQGREGACFLRSQLWRQPERERKENKKKKGREEEKALIWVGGRYCHRGQVCRKISGQTAAKKEERVSVEDETICEWLPDTGGHLGQKRAWNSERGLPYHSLFFCRSKNQEGG